MAKMAKNKQTPSKEKRGQEKYIQDYKLERELHSQYDSAKRYRDLMADDSYCNWDEKESLLLGRLQDQESINEAYSQVYDPRLSTIVMERSARVMAQMPTGKVQAMTKADKAMNVLGDIVLNRYIIPNANSQWDLHTKFRIENLYSNVYGSFFHMVTYRVEDDYIGPDIQLIPIRNLLPQAGKYSLEDCQYVFVESTVSWDWLKRQNKEVWKNLDKIDMKLQEQGGAGDSNADKNSKDKSYVESLYNTDSPAGKGKYADITIVTRYEDERWVTFAPSFGDEESVLVIRDIKNPFGNFIPIVAKHSFPLMDRFWGLGEFERGKSLQYGINSLINYYLDGVKMSIYPPIVMGKDGVIRSTIKYRPGAHWIEKQPNSIREFRISPQGQNTFQSTYQFFNAALLNAAGTTDTTISSETDMTQGKTPQALKQVAQRQLSRDAFDRYMQEKAIEQTYEMFLNILTKKQEKPIDIYIFKEEIESLQQTHPEASEELMEVYESGEFGKLNLKKGDLSKAKQWKFFIDTGTTMQKDSQTEQAEVLQLIEMLSKVPGIADQIPNGKVRMGDYEIDFGELIKRLLVSSGVDNQEKIIKQIEEGVPAEQMDPAIMQQIQQIQDPRTRQLAEAMIMSNQQGQPVQMQQPPMQQPQLMQR